MQLLRKALKIRPKSTSAWNLLGLVLHVDGKFYEAAGCFKKALKYDPKSAQAFNNLGASLHLLDEPDRAIPLYRKAVALIPQYADAWRNLGNALKATGQIEEARHAYESAIDADPRQTAAYAAMADCKRFEPGDPHVAKMAALARETERLTETDRINLHFVLAKAMADIGDYASSFHHLLAGNALKRQRLTYDEHATLEKFERLRRVFTSDFILERRRGGEASATPVFVIGMMRSGTTLIEQILASHPEIVGVGERADFSIAVEASLPIHPKDRQEYPEAVTAMLLPQLHQIGARYLASIRKGAPRAARIVNKQPTNFLFAGMIAAVLPGARIIHARRNPVDTCLSCLATDFRGDLPFTYDVGEMARYYRAYEALMGHWREVLPPETMIEVEYEQLVADLEGQARRMIAHCGLEWNDDCVAFHATKRIVLTASATQVRQPLYHSSVGRARRYGTAARPLYDALGLTL